MISQISFNKIKINNNKINPPFNKIKTINRIILNKITNMIFSNKIKTNNRIILNKITNMIFSNKIKTNNRIIKELIKILFKYIFLITDE